MSVGGDGTASISITTPEGVLAICVGCTGNNYNFYSESPDIFSLDKMRYKFFRKVVRMCVAQPGSQRTSLGSNLAPVCMDPQGLTC